MDSTTGHVSDRLVGSAETVLSVKHEAHMEHKTAFCKALSMLATLIGRLYILGGVDASFVCL